METDPKTSATATTTQVKYLRARWHRGLLPAVCTFIFYFFLQGGAVTSMQLSTWPLNQHIWQAKHRKAEQEVAPTGHGAAAPGPGWMQRASCQQDFVLLPVMPMGPSCQLPTHILGRLSVSPATKVLQEIVLKALMKSTRSAAAPSTAKAASGSS